jgi:dolichyl-phosphate-mannose-protein mannosyltransferase
LGGWAWIFHLNPTNLINTTQASVALRVLPALAGAAIIPVFYLFLRALGASRRMCALGAALLLLDNALLVESRFVLVDSMLILFGLASVTFYLWARRKNKYKLILLSFSAVFGGLAASTKWTGLTALSIVGGIWLFDHIKLRGSYTWSRHIYEACLLILIPVIVYLSVFFIHFSLLPRTGQGDAFMPSDFQHTLIGNESYSKDAHLSFIHKFIELNVEMVQSEDGLKTATHPYGSKWTSWPLMIRDVYYWQGNTLSDGRQGNIYLLGNPVVWWGILLIIIVGVFASAKAINRLRPFRFALVTIIIGYALNYLPFTRIIRVMFLYHYFFALIYSLAFAVLLLGTLANWTDHDDKFWYFSSYASRNLYVGVLITGLIGFLYFLPLSYGIPISQSNLMHHMWLNTWR